jgi:hypothetical protein
LAGVLVEIGADRHFRAPHRVVVVTTADDRGLMAAD